MKKLFVLLTVIVTMAMAQAQEMSRPQLETGRVAEAVGLYKNGDNQKAIELLLQEIGVNKKNGYAYFYMTYIFQYSSIEQLGVTEEEFQKIKDPVFLLNGYDEALKCLPKKDKDYQSLSYYYKAMIFQANELFVESNEMLDKAFKLIKSGDYLQEKGHNCIYMDKYEEAKSWFEAANNIFQSSSNYLGLAIAHINLEEYDKAIEMARIAISYDDERKNYALAQLARAYVETGDYISAVEPAIAGVLFVGYDWMFEQLFDLMEKQPELIVAKLKIALIEHPEKEGLIKDLLSRVYYFYLDDYRNTIKYALELKALAPDYKNSYFLLCYSYLQLDEYVSALSEIENLIALDSLNSHVYALKFDAYDGLGDWDKALAAIEKAIVLDPKNGVLYSHRALVYRRIGKIDDAIDDYFMAMTLIPDDSYFVLQRGVLLKQQNKHVAAEADFRKVIEMDSLSGRYQRMCFAYCFLGEKEKAIAAFVEGYAQKEIGDYDAACVYSLLGEKEMALRYLERALDNGFSNFVHIEKDTDLDNIRELPEFKALIDRYKNQ